MMYDKIVIVLLVFTVGFVCTGWARTATAFHKSRVDLRAAEFEMNQVRIDAASERRYRNIAEEKLRYIGIINPTP